MAASAIDEAVRNCIAVGADPRRIAILDNFCWGTTDRAETLGSLVRAALGCHDLAVALGTPFISGKDSLNNEFRPVKGKGDGPPYAQKGTVPFSSEAISIPPSLLISAMGQIDDVGHCITMDLKRPGNYLYQLGLTKNELGGSHFALVEGLTGGEAPKVDAAMAKKTFAALHRAIYQGLVRSCHDLSEGGLAVAVAEMAFAGGFGAKMDLNLVPCAESPLPLGEGQGEGLFDSEKAAILLFSESNTRFICEVTPENTAAFEEAMSGIACAKIGEVVDNDTVKIFLDALMIECDLATLKESWQKPLRW